MTFNDIFKSSFLENVTSVSFLDMAIALALAFGLGMFIFLVYKKTYQGVMYSSSFGTTLVALTMITTVVILAVTSNVVLSLGMVGALSIVRFRTAVKDPMDLVFLYWSISVGIMVGAGQKSLAVLLCDFATLAILIFDLLPVARAPMLLLVNAKADKETDEAIQAAIKAGCKDFQEKSRSISRGQLDLVVELRVKDGIALTDSISRIQGVGSVSLMKHDGEVTY